MPLTPAPLALMASKKNPSGVLRVPVSMLDLDEEPEHVAESPAHATKVPANT